MFIAILNQSTRATDDDVATMTRAIALQVRLDVAPLWDRIPAAVVYYDQASAVPPNAHVITLVDSIDDQPKGVLATTRRTRVGGSGVSSPSVRRWTPGRRS